ncbi:RAVE protein 1 C terminal-domain-containing protein [Mycotypha africana]|uniref:RAVE protein 1 C terminal-domain-containing protein n=1 Tax=Mycotypha africana TaxID=64632 RepID=UPI00230107E7|nr:RAVE protein 1 C terminal-domain-containing protein [Mycotypha africana]KAI8971923.1 RAVE protein 1 C terminal-domain-containing protein [Mycotypha africana]
MISLHVFNIEEDPLTKERSFLLIGVARRQIITWHLSSVNNHLHITYRGFQEMQWEKSPHLVQSAAEWTTNTASRLFQQLSQPKRVVLTVSFDTQIIFYNLNLEKTEIQWDELYRLDVSSSVSEITLVKCAPNVIAVAFGKTRQKLSIFAAMRSGLPPRLIKTFNFEEPIRDVAWNLTSDAQYLLAIAFPNKVCIYGQKRVRKLVTEDDTWACYTQFSIDSPDTITALAWVDCGVLSVISGNQIRCYLKWLSEGDKINEDVLRNKDDNNLKPMSSIFDISNEMNGPLPFYHPRHLFHYLMWGKIGFIHCILRSLHKFFKQFIDEEDRVVNEVPTIPLKKLLKLQKDTKHTNDSQQYDALFDMEDQMNVDDDDNINSIRLMTANEMKNLIYSLEKRALPGLSKSERLQLIALIDTIIAITNQGESLDENGVRFRTIVENHFHLKKTLSEAETTKGLQSGDYIWAFHSQSQDLLLDRCRQLCDGKFVWEDARALGIFMWLHKIDVVREQMTVIARNIYLSKADFRDPVDCTLYYFALRKKQVVQTLWNTASYHKEQLAMKKFLANDFNEPRWQRAASKNAFALLGKQRFEYAAAFFLLADKLGDAVNVIIKNVKDYQLAIAICRVYDGDDSPILKELLQNTVLPLAMETNDRWLASMALWLLNKQDKAIRAVVDSISNISEDSTASPDEATNVVVHDPNAFILYNFLKKNSLYEQSGWSYALEYEFSLQVARAYERLGCPLLGLYILTEFYMHPPSIKSEYVNSNTDGNDNGDNTKLHRAEDLFSSSVQSPTAVASNFFTEEPLKRPSYATDLFADDRDIFSSLKPSFSQNLFDDEEDDIFATVKKSSVSDDIFANEDGNQQEESSSISLAEDNFEREDDGLDSYKALLVIRILQTFFNAASAIYNSLQEPDNAYEINYRSHFLLNRETLLELGSSVDIPPTVFSRLLTEKSIETDVFPLYLRILDQSVPPHFDVHHFLRTFKVGCFEVNEVALMAQEQVIKTFSIWNRLRNQYCNPESAAFTTRQIALTTYLSNILITLKERQYESSWPFLYHLKGFLEAVGNKNGDSLLSSCLNQLLNTEIKMADIAPDECEGISDGSLFGYDMSEEVYRPLIDSQDKSVGANILELASINYILSVIEHAMQCQGKHSTLSGK